MTQSILGKIWMFSICTVMISLACSDAQAQDPGFVVGFSGLWTPIDHEEHGTYGGDYSELPTKTTGGVRIYGGYRINQFVELGLRSSMIFPHPVDEPGTEKQMGLLLRLLPYGKLNLSLGPVDLYAFAEVGYSFFRSPAYYPNANGHGVSLGGGLGVQVPLFDRLHAFVESECLVQPSLHIEPNHGYLRSSDLNLSAGLAFLF